ncbi:MAG: D-tyrosyl-tRNA(Tyr) deacylase [Bacilli bacterium]|nr:D-tyrosyl-tRNA(Tyr) deacylase [Bacilli bacterium]MBN2876094.1 D-tyrosyl-tRNA(Tyr) deacylase [Bacilli bacterium]
MKVIVQRVKSASVTVNHQVVSTIQNGYLLLIGMKHDDGIEEIEYVARKVAKLRIFDDEDGKINRSIHDIDGEILSISQFTVYGDTSGSNRPSFTEAMEYQKAQEFYHEFNRLLKEEYQIPVKTGVFGEHMEVSLVNDGPVTIIIERTKD